jgi:hypothetical protein
MKKVWQNGALSANEPLNAEAPGFAQMAMTGIAPENWITPKLDRSSSDHSEVVGQPP